MPGDARFAKGNRAGGVVEQQRRLTFSREDNAQRIGAKAAVFAAKRGNHRVAYDADEVDRNKTCRRALLGPVADASDMMRVAQGDSRHTVLPGFLNSFLHRFMGNYLTKACVAVECHYRAGVLHHAGMAVKLQMTLSMGTQVARDHPHPV